MLLILFFILVLNIVAIALTYYCLSELEKKEKIIFIAIGVGIIYVLTSLAYWISTKDVAIKEVSEMGKNLITFLFVPINAIIILPILAKSYAKYEMGSLPQDKLKKRSMVFIILLVILLIIECSYFKDIQNSVVSVIEKNKQEQELNKILSNETENNILGNEATNNILSNEVNNNVLANITSSSAQK